MPKWSVFQIYYRRQKIRVFNYIDTPTKQARCAPTPPGTKPTYRPLPHRCETHITSHSRFTQLCLCAAVLDELLVKPLIDLRTIGWWWREWATAQQRNAIDWQWNSVDSAQHMYQTSDITNWLSLSFNLLIRRRQNWSSWVSWLKTVSEKWRIRIVRNPDHTVQVAKTLIKNNKTILTVYSTNNCLRRCRQRVFFIQNAITQLFLSDLTWFIQHRRCIGPHVDAVSVLSWCFNLLPG